MAGNPSDYLVVTDTTKPSTWHLPVKRNGKPSRSLAAKAWAALHSNFRGNPYSGPDKSNAIGKLTALYKSQGWTLPGKGSVEHSNVIWGATNPHLVELASKGSGNELSHDEIRQLLQSTISGGSNYGGGGYVRDVYPTHFVHSDGAGGMFDRSYSVGNDMSVTMGPPRAVKARTGYDPVKMATFAIDRSDAEMSEDGEFVIRRGKVFEAGEYPDKKFSVTQDEMAEAIDAFEAVPIDSEHRPSIFDGKLGQMFHVDVGDQPTDMQGWIAIPKWLDEVVGDGELKVSTTWSREPHKRIEKLALTVDPRVEDAAMLSAITSYQQVHSPLQQSLTQTDNEGNVTITWQAKPSQGLVMPRKERTLMSVFDKIKSALAASTAEELAEFASATEDSNVDDNVRGTIQRATEGVQLTSLAPSADFARIQALEAQLAEMAAKERKAEAATFVDSIIKDRRLLPAQRSQYIAELSKVMEIEAKAASSVTFSKADETEVTMSLTELVKANLSGLPQHDLFRDHSPASLPKDAVILHGGSTDTKSEFEQGLEEGRKYAEMNYGSTNNGNSNGNVSNNGAGH